MLDLSQSPLRRRLALAFAVLIVAMFGVGLIGWRTARYFADSFADLYENNVHGAVYLAESETALWKLRYGFPQFLVLGPDERQKIVDDEPKHYRKIEAAMKAYGQGQRTPEERAALTEFTEVFAKYVASRPKWFQLMREGKIEEAASWRAATTTPFGAGSVKALEKLIALQREVGQEKKAEVDEASPLLFIQLASLLAVAVLFCVGLGWLLTRSVVRQLSEVSSHLGEAAAQLEAAAKEQEAMVAHQAGGVEEVSRTVQSLLESASHIADTASVVLGNAERTKTTTDATSGRITELNSHANRMGEILEAIREIADRSDLLALNASLEASRSGEDGRAFALLASEMRRLAERVTSSVQDVKVLVGDVRSSGSATVIATEEARKLADSTTESARQITQVTKQQRTATEQVAENMRGVSGLLSQSVAATQQTRASAESLRAQAGRLTSIIGQRQLR